ncbi:YcgN family cysteine cluster protein [uncultured Sneathiella sp.]|uniref:YcgN family cysteine cluster protein n=1 Tax=uncultured Sneathiella sp. TaxID=879315 RepID=UPI002595EA5D|nr:YcgN family cysteine cluster protein [uncultured Sneathiella sp.]
MKEKPFWETVALEDMSAEQWESLCDGCGKCCLLKLEDEDTLELAYTEVVCRLLDLGTCQCTRYPERSRLVPDCITLTPDIIPTLRWMPRTCAYRLLSEGKPLPWWHPLISKDPETVHQAGISVRGRAVSERRAGDLEDHIVDWPDEDVG